MTPTELESYRALCREWPECEHPRLVFDHSVKCHRYGQELLRKDDPEVGRAVVGHLESILDAKAPGWGYTAFGELVHESQRCRYITPTRDGDGSWHWDPSRLLALFAAVRAVLGAAR